MGKLSLTHPNNSLSTIAKQLSGIPETLLIPLIMRAAETKRSDAIIKDERAAQIVSELNHDQMPLKKSWMTQVDIAVRTEILDQAVSDFIKRNPESLIVNIGAGLDSRFYRVDNGKIRWYDLDLPEVINMRRKFYSEDDRLIFLSKSLLDFSWIDDIQRIDKEPVLVIAEGVLHYFDKKEVQAFFGKIANLLQGAELLIHSTSPLSIYFQPRFLRKLKAPFKWGIWSTDEITSWDSRYKIIDEWYFIDRYRSRWGWLRHAAKIPLVKHEIQASMKITHMHSRLGKT